MRFATLTAAVALCASAAAPAAGQTPFEGTITYRLSTPDGAGMDMTHHVKGDKVRMDVSGPMGPTSMIMDSRDQTMTVLIAGQKSYMTMDMKAMAEMAANSRAADEAAAIDIEATGRSETIAGHRCEHYLMTYQATEVDVCAASGMGFYMGSTTPMAGAGQRGSGIGLSETQSAALRARFKNGFLPLKMTIRRGEAATVLEATSVSRQAVQPAVFAVPSDYTELKMPGGM